MMNGTIKRKLVFGLVLVFCLSATMTASGIVGLISYKNVILNLDLGLNVAPHRTELVEAVSALFEPLRISIDKNLSPAKRQQVADLQYRHFAAALDNATAAHDTFWRRTESLPASEVISGRRAVTQPILIRMKMLLADLRHAQPLLKQLEKRDSVEQVLRREVADLVTYANQLPDPTSSLRNELEHARRVYRSSWNTLITTSVAGLCMFLGLIYYGYAAIFSPLKKLHAGAVRVAHGDFDHRVAINTKDEMSELADSFNKMTTRFQETKSDLDDQVRQRVAQLVRSERLAGVGFLAAGVAHEINNPLSAIQMAADSLQDRVGAVERAMESSEAAVVKQYFHLIQNEADRCRQITSKLLDFARGQDGTRSRVDVSSLIREVRDMIQLLSKHRGKQILFDRAEPCYLEINGAEIKQVFLNLVANALESMDPGGVLSIGMLEHTDQVIISFQDDGCGMTEEVRGNLFQPFFTQRRGGQGTGLGLSISNRIVHDHGGTLEAKSAGPGMGSTFLVRLPRRAQAQGAAA